MIVSNRKKFEKKRERKTESKKARKMLKKRISNIKYKTFYDTVSKKIARLLRLCFGCHFVMAISISHDIRAHDEADHSLQAQIQFLTDTIKSQDENKRYIPGFDRNDLLQESEVARRRLIASLGGPAIVDQIIDLEQRAWPENLQANGRLLTKPFNKNALLDLLQTNIVYERTQLNSDFEKSYKIIDWSQVFDQHGELIAYLFIYYETNKIAEGLLDSTGDLNFRFVIKENVNIKVKNWLIENIKDSLSVKIKDLDFDKVDNINLYFPSYFSPENYGHFLLKNRYIYQNIKSHNLALLGQYHTKADNSLSKSISSQNMTFANKSIGHNIRIVIYEEDALSHPALEEYLVLEDTALNGLPDTGHSKIRWNKADYTALIDGQSYGSYRPVLSIFAYFDSGERVLVGSIVEAKFSPKLNATTYRVLVRSDVSRLGDFALTDIVYDKIINVLNIKIEEAFELNNQVYLILPGIDTGNGHVLGGDQNNYPNEGFDADLLLAIEFGLNTQIFTQYQNAEEENLKVDLGDKFIPPSFLEVPDSEINSVLFDENSPSYLLKVYEDSPYAILNIDPRFLSLNSSLGQTFHSALDLTEIPNIKNTAGSCGDNISGSSDIEPNK